MDWDGTTRKETLKEDVAQMRENLAEAAKNYDWPRVLELAKYSDLVNTTRPSGKSLYTPLHQAAHGGAPIEVAKQLIDYGAWRTIQNARGERPIDVAERRGHRHLINVLLPQYKHHVPIGVLLKIQSHFHNAINQRADQLVREHALRLPELEPLLELDRPEMWFSVPGMYGGFNYRLERTGVDAKLVSESWCRVVEGSCQRHEITSIGSQRIEMEQYST